MTDPDFTILSIDIGSVTLAVIELDLQGKIVASRYVYHRGQVYETLQSIEHLFSLDRVGAVVSPGRNGWLASTVHQIDSQSSLIRAATHYQACPGALLSVGAGRFQLLNFDAEGQFSHSATNTSCAAGTGSFLDQQAGRLNLDGPAHLCELANRNTNLLPEIASRCSVFAKTDLIHAQQAGYSLESICDSLCRGLAKNIVDTLFEKKIVPEPLLFVGGVSRNSAVRRHLETLLQVPLIVPDGSHLFAAMGAAFYYLDDYPEGIREPEKVHISDFFVSRSSEKRLHYPALRLRRTDYPDFNGRDQQKFQPTRSRHPATVQVDTYLNGQIGQSADVWMGLDIGSTSTKAILIDRHRQPLAGFYTYTSGQPLSATRALFEAMNLLQDQWNTQFRFMGVGTTGSGRKFIGALIGADQVLDEITTHARAAFELNPDTDTIIEIGGQDAKFTLIRNGHVTFSQMNAVCAAGTGSFIEEQANKLGVPLHEYTALAENARAPLASDRCTVFMERDINHYFNQGYAREEILASVLHSVRENYLKKVATESSIGKHVCFQGATAKNRALVAAFEQKLDRPIFVSQFCHLTGALGSALLLADENCQSSQFKGLQLIHEHIRISTETCPYCNNHCQITLAEVRGKKVAYGFLCGRDYDTHAFIDNNTSGFDLIRARKKIFGRPIPKPESDRPTIGLPSALNMFEELVFWKTFFQVLGFPVVTTTSLKDPVDNGKRLAGAEFCAPMHALHGHVDWLSKNSDYIFHPAYIEAREKNELKEANYCYYTQFSPSVVSLINKKIREKCLIPFLNYAGGEELVIKTLYKILKELDPKRIRLWSVKSAYLKAKEDSEQNKFRLKELYLKELGTVRDVSVVLLGRPYLVLAKDLNKGIPELFAAMGIKTFYQDMIAVDEQDTQEMYYMLRSMPWYFVSQVLEATRVVARTENVYPVFITGFKCAPDSFVMDYFQKIMDGAGKPYLVLQVDEHDSNVGYETRIEAALRAFRYHSRQSETRNVVRSFRVKQPVRTLPRDKIVLFPNWDAISGRFVVANLRRSGFDVRLMDHTAGGIQKGMAHNTGQCLPLNIIAQDYMDYIEKEALDPARTILWMTETRLTCNIRMYPQYIQTILQNYGKGMEKAAVYSGELAHTEISLNTTYYAYFAYMLGGLLRRLGNRIRPYEVRKGETNLVLEAGIRALEKSFTGQESIERTLRELISRFEKIETIPQNRPLVALFGDFFVRDNDVMNQGLVQTVEEAGGEVLNTPYNEYFKLTSENVMRRRVLKGQHLEVLGYRALLSAIKLLEKKYYRYFEPFLGRQTDIQPRRLEKHLEAFNIFPYHSGESYDNILKIFHILETHPEVALFVQTNPAFCCPSLVTEAMKDAIREYTGVPIVTITYDGTTEKKNDIVIPYLDALRRKETILKK